MKSHFLERERARPHRHRLGVRNITDLSLTIEHFKNAARAGQLLALFENRDRIGFHRLDPVGGCIELAAQRCRHQTMAVPVKEPDVELGLKFTNQLRDRRLRDAETSCRSREIAGLKHRVHGAHARRR